MPKLPDLDPDAILRDAREVAFPRYPGTDGDRRAIAWVADKLRDAGLEVEVQPFTYDLRPAFRALRAVLVAAAALVGASGLLAPAAPGRAAILLAAGLAAGGLVLGWAPGREELYRRPGPTATANVAGWRRVDRPRLTLILLAHHDSKSQSLTLPWRAGMTLLAIAGGLGLLALLAAGLVRGAPIAPSWLAPACGLAGAAALLVLATLRNGDLSPGGVDNAGSLALVLELARRLPAASPADVEWVFLSPGAEEDHMIGAMRWLDAHREALRGRPVWALNFDGVGIPGRLVLMTRYGFGRPFSPPLTAAAKRAAAELGERVRTIVTPPAMGVDAIPFVQRGLDCLTISSGSLGRAALSVHSANDRAEHLDRDTLRRGARLGAALALALATREP